MSQSHWTVEGYGIDNDVLNKVSLENLKNVFFKLHPEASAEWKCDSVQKFKKLLDDDEDGTILSETYNDKYGFMSPDGVVVDLLNQWFNEHGFKGAGMFLNAASNEDGDECIVMESCYPFTMDGTYEAYQSYLRLSMDNIGEAFRWALSEVGYEMNKNYPDFFFQSIECWG